MSLGGKGRGRGALKTITMPGMLENTQERRGELKPHPSELYEARVTDILDCTTFYVQIGTAAALEKFDHHCAALNDWCLENKAVLKTMPKVNDIVAVLEKESVTWVRAKVTRQISDSHIEVFYIDTGTSGRVTLDAICAATSPLLYQCPAQALQCSLKGVELPDLEDSWSMKAVSWFTELLKGATKIQAWIHPSIRSCKSVGAICSSLTLYIMHEEKWTSVGEIMAREKLCKYTPPGPIYLEAIPSVPQRLVRRSDDSSSVPPESTSEEDSSDSTLAELREVLKGKVKPLSDLAADNAPSQEPGINSPKTPPLDELDPTPVPSEEGLCEVVGGERGGKGEGRDGKKVAKKESILKEKVAVEEQGKERKIELSERNELTNAVNSKMAVATKESSEVAIKTTKPAAKTAAAVDKKGTVSGMEGRTKSGLDSLLNDSDSDGDDAWDWSFFPTRSEASLASRDSSSKADLFASSEDTMDTRRKAQLQAQYNAIMADDDKTLTSGHFQHGSPQRRKPFHRRQGGQDRTPYLPGVNGYQGGVEFEGGDRGEWSKWGGGSQGRRFRPAVRAGRGQSRSDMVQEGVPGAMRGVRVNRLPRDQQFGGERGGRGFGVGGRGTRLPPRLRKQPNDPLQADSGHPPPIANELPVELFNSKPRVITGMSQGEAKNEVEWHVWKMKQKVKKKLETLSSSTAPSFGSEVKELLEDPSGQRLATLSSSKGPLWYILECMVFEAIGKPSETIDAIVEGIGSIHRLASNDVCQLLQPVLQGLAHDTCEGSVATDAQKNRHSFCCLVGKLLIKASYSDREELSAAVGRVVRQFLNTWSQCAPGQRDLQCIAFADCFAALSEEIGPTIDVTNKSTLDAYFDGVIKEHILAAKLPRSVRERLLEVSLKRASGWGGATNRPHLQSQANIFPTAAIQQQQQQQQQGPQPAFQSVRTLPQPAIHQQTSTVPSSSLPSGAQMHQQQQHRSYLLQNFQQPATSSQEPSQPLQSLTIAPAFHQPSQPLQSPTLTPAHQYPSQVLQYPPTFISAHQYPSHPLQSPTFVPAPQYPSHPLQSPPALQHSSQPLQSPPASQYPSHPLQSPPAPQHSSHPLQSPPASQYPSHPLQSPPALQHSSHPLQSPPTSQYSSHPLQSPPAPQHPSHPLQPSTFTPALQHSSHPLQSRTFTLAVQNPPPASTILSSPAPMPPTSQPLDCATTNPYSRVEEMLNALGLSDLLAACKQAMIKDSILDCKREELKLGLKEAGLPIGAIIAIADYLEKSRHQRRSSFSSTHSSGSVPPTHAPTPVPLSPPQVDQQPSQMAAVPGPLTQGFPSAQTTAGQYGIGFVSPPVPSQTGSAYSALQYQYTTGTSVQQVTRDSAPPTVAAPEDTTGGKPPAPRREEYSYGFGGVRCVVCGSQSHKSEDCSERSKRFFI